MKYILPAFNALAATKLKLFFVKLFGKKTVTTESGSTATVHEFRGKHYLTDYRRQSHDKQN